MDLTADWRLADSKLYKSHPFYLGMGRWYYRKERKLIFAIAMTNGNITSRELSDLTNKTVEAASHQLLELHSSGWLNRTFSNKEQKYYYSPSTLLMDKYDTYMQLDDD